MRITSLFIFVLALMPLASGQVMSSTNFQIDALTVDSTVGGASNAVVTNYVEIGGLKADTVSSTNFNSDIGFLASYDPDPGTTPVIYGIVPPYGDRVGGTPISIYGRNLGQGLAPTVTINGNTIFPTVVSDTVITGTTPYGPLGQVDVELSHANGTLTLNDGWVNWPAIITPEFAYQDSLYPLQFYGEFGNLFSTWLSLGTFEPGVATEFGPLLIGPTLINVITPFPYFDPSNKTVLPRRLPIDPILPGITIYLQNLDFDPFFPPGRLTNRTQTTFR
jgi:hypothetical protein